MADRSEQGEAVAAEDEVVQLRAEVDRLTQGSAWRERILNFVMAAEADDTMKELIDEQIRRRQEDLCRTENRYIEVSEALTKAGLAVTDGTVFYRSNGQPVPISDLLAGVRI